jgi:hypothetical protein
MTTLGKLIIFVVLLCISGVAGYINGRQDGRAIGWSAALGEAAQVQSEYDLAMQKAGLCKWARVAAQDARCEKELP